MSQWGSKENYIAIGYLKYAIEDFNKRSNEKLSEEQQCKLIGSMHYAFDILTEEEAYNKA